MKTKKILMLLVALIATTAFAACGDDDGDGGGGTMTVTTLTVRPADITFDADGKYVSGAIPATSNNCVNVGEVKK